MTAFPHSQKILVICCSDLDRNWGGHLRIRCFDIKRRAQCEMSFDIHHICHIGESVCFKEILLSRSEIRDNLSVLGEILLYHET